MNDPYLYDVYSILTVNDKVVDVQKINTGFRKAEFKGGAGTGGVCLNDNLSVSTGYAQRSADDWAGLGQAYPDWMHDFNAQLRPQHARQLHPLDAHFAAGRGCARVRQGRHRRSLPGGRQGKAMCTRPRNGNSAWK